MKILEYQVPVISNMVQKEIKKYGIENISRKHGVDLETLKIFDDELLFMDVKLYEIASAILNIPYDELTKVKEIRVTNLHVNISK